MTVPANDVYPAVISRRKALCHTTQVLLAFGAFSQNAWSQSASSAPLQFGMVPYLPIQQLVRLYEPLTRSFEQLLQRPCRLASATDFDQFLERARKGDFDILGASPHLLRILQKEEGFEPLARSTAPLEPVVLVAKGSSVTNIASLRDQRVWVADLLAVQVLIALRGIRDAGVKPAKGTARKLCDPVFSAAGLSGWSGNRVLQTERGCSPALVRFQASQQTT